MPNLAHHQPLWAEGREEEELLLLQGEEGARREEERKEIKIHTRTGSGLSSHVDLVMTLTVPFRSIYSISGLHLINTISRICSWWHRETALHLPKRRKFTNFGDIWCISQSSQQTRPTRKTKIAPQKFKIVLSTLLQPPVSRTIDSLSFFQKLP